MEFKNRQVAYPGRVKLIPVDEDNGIYDIVMMDEASQEGTPLNAETFEQFKLDILDGALKLGLKGDKGSCITSITVTKV